MSQPPSLVERLRDLATTEPLADEAADCILRLTETLWGLVNVATHPKSTKPDIRRIAEEARATLSPGAL